MDSPEYLELPESLLLACNEDDKDNVSSESGGGASSGGSVGSGSKEVIGSTSSTDTSNDTLLSHYKSNKTTFHTAKEHVSHRNYIQSNGDNMETAKDFAIRNRLIASGQTIELPSATEDTPGIQTSDKKSISSNGKGKNDPVTFGWKTKAVIYGSVFSSIGYLIYTYLHLILISLVVLFFYEIWDWISARRKQKSMNGPN